MAACLLAFYVALFLFAQASVVSSDTETCSIRSCPGTVRSRSQRGGKGLFAARGFRKDERVLAIPKELLVTQRVAVEVVEGVFGNDAGIKSRLEQDCTNVDPSVALLTLFLLLVRAGEACETCPWRAYILDLPTEHVSGINADREEVDSTRDLPRFHRHVQRLRGEAKRLYDGLGLSYDVKQLQEWMDAMAVTASRVHHVWVYRIGEWETEMALVPVADSMNTDAKEHINVECYTNRSTEGFDCIALTNIAASEELLVAYGGPRGMVLPTEDLLISYGFAMNAQCPTFQCGVERLRLEVNTALFLTALVDNFLLPNKQLLF